VISPRIDVIGSDPGEIASVKNVDCLIKVSLSSAPTLCVLLSVFQLVIFYGYGSIMGLTKPPTVLGWEGVGDGGHSAGFFPTFCVILTSYVYH